MPGYIANALHTFQHKQPDRPQHAPYPARTPQYGAKVQLTQAVLDSPTLTPLGRKRIQQVVGALLYYGRVIDGTIMTAIISLDSQQATATEDTEANLTKLLNYCSTHPDATIRYHASDMMLNIHSDAGYLNKPKARSRSGGHFFMSSTPKNGVQQHNGSILTLSAIPRMVVASAAEAETGALFLNAKEGVNIRNILKEMGHPQPATPMQTDNTTAHVILRGTCKQQRIKAIDMRFYWVRDRAQQGQFDIGWGPSAQNLGDYFTKHHPPVHHKEIRGMYLHSEHSPKSIPATHKKTPQGCVDSALSPGAPVGQQANSAITDKPSTATNWLCLVGTLFRAPHITTLSPHKFS
jgi:hypothetical protein